MLSYSEKTSFIYLKLFVIDSEISVRKVPTKNIFKSKASDSDKIRNNHWINSFDIRIVTTFWELISFRN